MQYIDNLYLSRLLEKSGNFMWSGKSLPWFCAFLVQVSCSMFCRSSSTVFVPHTVFSLALCRWMLGQIYTNIPGTLVLTLHLMLSNTVKPVFFAWPLFREFHEPGKFAKITGHENLNTAAFQCSRKQKRQNYGIQNNYIDSNAKIKGGQN